MFTALSDQSENAIGTHQTNYMYDQLNRIKSMQGLNRAIGLAATNSDYNSFYSYDANGNLDTLRRKAGSQGDIDDLSYNYDDPINGGFNNPPSCREI